MANIHSFNIYVLEDIPSLMAPGVGKPYVYYGAPDSFFPLHVKDLHLLSVNYQHQGKTKFWYVFREEHFDDVNRLAARLFPNDATACPYFLRHKYCLIDPRVFVANNIPVSVIAQEPGEFVITFLKGYHMGFNTDMNINEAINISTKKWPLYVHKCQRCNSGLYEDQIDISDDVMKQPDVKSMKKNSKKDRAEMIEYNVHKTLDYAHAAPSDCIVIYSFVGRRKLLPQFKATRDFTDIIADIIVSEREIKLRPNKQVIEKFRARMRLSVFRQFCNSVYWNAVKFSNESDDEDQHAPAPAPAAAAAKAAPAAPAAAPRTAAPPASFYERNFFH